VDDGKKEFYIRVKISIDENMYIHGGVGKKLEKGYQTR
jgi:hypothetical protein